MQIDAQDYLDLVEANAKLVFFDIESTGLRGDYNSVLVVSLKPYDQPAYSFAVRQAGNDQKVVRDVQRELQKYHCVAGYYSKGFDWKMLNTRLLKWGADPLEPMHHIDMYYTLKGKLNTARRSQGHLLSWLGTPEQKMTVGADVWNEILHNPGAVMDTMVARCESDVAGLEGLYKKTRHLIRDIKREG